MKPVNFNVTIRAQFPIKKPTERWTIRFGTDKRNQPVVFLKPESAKGGGRPIPLEAVPLFLGKIARRLATLKKEAA
jgi:hypothetical protein